MSGITRIFGGLLNMFSPQMPSVPAPPVAPTAANSSGTLDAAAEEQRRALLAGRSSTVLTGGAGVTDMGATSTSKLLGSA